MPDKIVPLWKVVGEVSETAGLDHPDTQYHVLPYSYHSSMPYAEEKIVPEVPRAFEDQKADQVVATAGRR